MSTEAPRSTKEPAPNGSRWSFLRRVASVPATVKSAVTEILQERKIQKLGEPLIVEARNLFRHTTEYETERLGVCRAASGYESLERPRHIGAEFVVGRNRYNVRVTETQSTDPLALLMSVSDAAVRADEPDATAHIELRYIGVTTRPHISYRKKGEQRDSEYVWEKSSGTRRTEAIIAAQNIRQTLDDLRKDLIARDQAASSIL